MARLLVVEDQAALLQSLRRGLEEEGHAVFTAMGGTEAYMIATREPLDAVILDLALPDGDGLSTMRRLRDEGFVKPIIIVTARDSVQDRIIGLDSGADDYLVKPFSFDELLARLRALLRRNFTDNETVLRYDNLEIDLLARTVKRDGEVITLTQRQFDLLEYLMHRCSQVVSREMIARDVWKAATATWTNVIDVQINQLRKRIERPHWKTVLHTVRGEGYRLGDSP
ncbi:MAG: response regulator transcription factor [Planctomycetaceae bacterium]|nr:response regulator transcription factor [Planctomycetaceae bacterium]